MHETSVPAIILATWLFMLTAPQSRGETGARPEAGRVMPAGGASVGASRPLQASATPSPTASQAMGTPYLDMLPDDPDLPAIRTCDELGITQVWNGKWFPDKVVNRYQWAVTLSRTLDRVHVPPPSVAEVEQLEDVRPGHWAHEAVLKIRKYGLGGTGRQYGGARVLDGQEMGADLQALGRLAGRIIPGPVIARVHAIRRVRRRDMAAAVAVVLHDGNAGPFTPASPR